MKFNQWTVGLAAAGVVSLASAVNAEEAKSAVQTMLSHTTISGYVDTSAIYRFGTGNGYIPGRSFDQGSPSPSLNKQDGFNLNVVKLTIEKPLDEGQWAAGYKVDLLYGPDANVFNTASLGVTAQDFAVKNAYIHLRAPVGNGLDLKVGVWDTIIGYEVFEAGNNPNYSRSYGYFIEPFVHTGVLASYRLADFLTASAGIADSSRGFGSLPGTSTGNTINGRSAVESRKDYMASIALTAPENFGALKGSTLYAGFIDSNVDFGGKDRQNFYVGATVNTPVKGLSVGAAYDYVANGVFNSSYANAVSLYGSFQASDKLKLNLRGEYATSSGGTFTGSVGSATKDDEKFFGLTATLDYALWANVISRVEFRWDHDAAGGANVINTGNSDGTGAFKNVTSVAVNLIYKF